MKLNQYEWDPKSDQIGEGAFADVFKAKDQYGRFVALKIYRESVIKGTTSGSIPGKYSLEQEYQKGELLSHTNVIRYLGFDFIEHIDAMGREASYPVLAMEYAEDGSLSSWLKSATPPNFNEALSIIKEIFSGLAYLHSQSIIHRDLKPGNILFKKDRLGKKVAKISDFGISRDALQESTGTVGVGTVEYMAPEQFQKKKFGYEGDISNRTDIWAAGVILYRMLAERLPFGGEKRDYETLEEDILEKEPNYILIPPKFHALLKGCFEKQASKRFPNAEAALRMIENIENGKEAPIPEKIATRPIPEKIAPRETDNEATVVNRGAPARENISIKTPPLVPIKQTPVKKNKGAAIGTGIGIAVLIIIRLAFYMNHSSSSTSSTPNYTTNDNATKTEDPNSTNDTRLQTYKKMVDDQATNTNYVTNTVFYEGTANECTYTGGVKNNLMDGEGEAKYSNGNVYAGSFSNGFMNGHGTYLWNDGGPNTGDRYVGGWAMNKMQGEGTYYWHSGLKYVGNWGNGSQNGFGIQYNTDGSVFYSGEWLNGKQATQ